MWCSSSRVGGAAFSRSYDPALAVVRFVFYLLLASLYAASITWGLTTSYHISVLLYSNTLIDGSTRVSGELVSALGGYVVDVVDVGGGYVAAHSSGFVFWSTVASALARALGLGGGYLYLEHLRVLNALAVATGILAVLYVERLALLYVDGWKALLVASTYATGLSWVYTSIAYSQSFSAPFTAAGLYYLVRWIRERRPRDAAASLLALSLASTSDHTLVLLGLVAVVLALAGSRGARASAIALALYLLPLSAAALYYRLVAGVPLTTQTAYAERLGVVPLDPGRILGDLSLVELVLGPRKSLLVSSPALAISPILALPSVARPSRLRGELLLTYSTLVALLLAYSSWYDWHGGLSYGPRVVLSILPLTALLLSVSLSKGRFLEYLTAALSIPGAVFSSLAISTNPVSCAYQELATGLLPQPVVCNYPRLAPGCRSPTLLGATGVDCLGCFYLYVVVALLITLLPLVARVRYGGVAGKA